MVERRGQPKVSEFVEISISYVEPLRKDPNRGIRFLRSCSNPINVGKLGSSRSFIKKKDKEYYQKQRRYMKLTETTVKIITNKYRDI